MIRYDYYHLECSHESNQFKKGPNIVNFSWNLGSCNTISRAVFLRANIMQGSLTLKGSTL